MKSIHLPKCNLHRPLSGALLFVQLASVLFCSGCDTVQPKEALLQNESTASETTEKADTTAPLEAETELPDEQIHTVAFPAYDDIRNSSNRKMSEETSPFTVAIRLPDGWSIDAPQSFDGRFHSPLTMLVSPLCFYRDGNAVGSIGFYPVNEDLSRIAPEREYTLACHPLMMGNASHWDNDYTEVKAEGSYKVGTCRISRRADLLDSGALAGSGPAAAEMEYFPAIAAYDMELGICLGIELEETAITEEEWKEIAESITITAGGNQTEWQLPATQSVQITFPAYMGGKNEHNAAIYETPFFRLEMQLPLGWRLSLPSPDKQTASLPFTPVTFLCDDIPVGSAGFMTFELYEGITPEDENFYRMVYNQLMLGNLVTWDIDYTPVQSTRTDTFCAATCYVSTPIVVEGVSAAGWEREESKAILAYDTEMLVYVAINFSEESGLTDKLWKSMAESIHLIPVS